MLFSLVLRLRTDQLVLGELVGEVEEVETGRRHVVRGTAELVELCQRAAGIGAQDGG